MLIEKDQKMRAEDQMMRFVAAKDAALAPWSDKIRDGLFKTIDRLKGLVNG